MRGRKEVGKEGRKVGRAKDRKRKEESGRKKGAKGRTIEKAEREEGRKDGSMLEY